MPDFFAIDLGTTNCAIKHILINDIGNLLLPRKTIRITSVPFYYQRYEYNKEKLAFCDSSDKTSGLIEQLSPRGFGLRAGWSRPLTASSSTVSSELLLMPSVVLKYQPEESSDPVYLIGEPALNEYTRRGYTGVLYENTKSLLDQHVETSNPSATDAVDIAEYLLKVCFDSIRFYKDKRGIRGEKIAITYPASRNQRLYLSNLRKAAKKAAIEAGLISSETPDDFFMTTQEPYAAILNLIFTESASINSDKTSGRPATSPLSLDEPGDKVILVVDLGGGTSDICLSIIRPDEATTRDKVLLCKYPEFTTRSGRRINCAVNLAGNFGGADIDRLLAAKILKKVLGGDGDAAPLENAHPNHIGPALNQAREMKHFFSNDEHKTGYTVHLPRIGSETAYITRAEYSSWLEPYIHSRVFSGKEGQLYKRQTDAPDTTVSIASMIQQTLRQANPEADFNCVDAVFLTGGTSKMPEVQNLLKELTRGTDCKLIISPNCFDDIAAGAALYAALNTQTEDGINYSTYTPAPRSSIALMCDDDNGKEPKILINHSEAIDGEEHSIRSAFKVTNTLSKSVQLFTGTSFTHPNFSKLQLLKIDLNGKAVEGTPLDLYYKIDQNMRATMSVGFKNASGEDVRVPMDGVHLDGSEEVSPGAAGVKIEHAEIARGIDGVIYVRGDHLVITVNTPQEFENLLRQAERNLEDYQTDGMMGASAARSAIKELAAHHLDVLCYAVMLYIHTICSYDPDEIKNYCRSRLPGVICEAASSLSEEDLKAFSKTFYHILCMWPHSQRWQVVNTVLQGTYGTVRIAEEYKYKIIEAFSASQLRDYYSWQGGTPAFDALMVRAMQIPGDAVAIFSEVFVFFNEYAGAGKGGISLPNTLSVECSPMDKALKSLPDDTKNEIIMLRTRCLDEAASDRKVTIEHHLTRCFGALTSTDEGWITTLNSKLGKDDEENVKTVLDIATPLKRMTDSNHLLSPACIKTFGLILGKTDEGRDLRVYRHILHLVLSHSCENGDTMTPARNALTQVPDNDDPLQHFFYSVSSSARAIHDRRFSQEQFNSLLVAHKNAVLNTTMNGFVGPVWKQFLNAKSFNPSFKSMMEEKLAIPSTLPSVEDARAMIECLYYAYYRDLNRGEEANTNVLTYAVPHEEICKYLLHVTGLDKNSKTSRSLSDMNKIVTRVLLLFNMIFVSNLYEKYAILFNRLNVYYERENPGSSFAKDIQEFMETNANPN